jgi:hypothetical protein
MIYVQLSCSYPLVNNFQRTILMNLIWKTTEIDDFKFKMLNVGISTVPLCFALFYPKIGSILGYAASVSGFFMIYVVPVITYMKMRKIEIMHPLLAAAIQENEVEVFMPQRRTDLPKNFEAASSPIMETGGSKDKLIEKKTENKVPQHLTSSPKIVITDRFLQRQQHDQK